MDRLRAVGYNGSVMGVLYLVATPIGNLEDITLRALRILRESSLIAAEDTRTTAKLLSRYDIHTPMISYFEHNEVVRQGEILRALESGDVALVSEAGMPAISDPGFRLVQAVTQAGLPVTVVPGASALLSALAVSGLPTDGFVFLGFLPRKRAARVTLLSEVRSERRTLVAYEAPHRLVETLEDVVATLGDRQVAVAAELTKLFEEVQRGSVSECLAHLREKPPRGEYTLVIEGAVDAPVTLWSEEEVSEALAALIQAGWSRRDAAAEISASSGWARRAVYRLAAGRPDPSTGDTK
ncbi:MAG TPA: 16S rRNA (cytidine(1402)-2'-O)-methyltransferase [Anaerolineae bacterium]|nr:16S rRNA (cytidine(1402)-2'-O)-methyltransferase [Anaerolineae bacterium]HQJ51086.1 16S rRNA (cytidine(1402)-2'-O)-methyltransferase [Anaerolineae bacterium]